MDEDFKRRLLNEIEKSGFPLELVAVEELREVMLNVFPNFNFTDEAGNPHEIDAFAMMSDDELEAEWPYGMIGLNLFVECKSSKEKPWVFFKEADDFMASIWGLVDRLECMTDIELSEPYPLLAGCFNSPLSCHHYKSEVPIARTYFEAFGKDTGRDIYKAVNNIWQALAFHKRFFKQSNSEEKENSKKRTIFVHGVIVYKGILVVAERQNDEFQLTEEPHVILRTTDCITDKRLPFGAERETVIDVLKMEYLKEYLSLCQKDLKLCAEHMKRLEQAGWLKSSVENTVTEGG